MWPFRKKEASSSAPYCPPSTSDFIFKAAEGKVISLCMSKRTAAMVVSNNPTPTTLWHALVKHEVTNAGYVYKPLEVDIEPLDNENATVAYKDLMWPCVKPGDTWRNLIVYAIDDRMPVPIPMTCHRLNVTPDGSDIIAECGVFYRGLGYGAPLALSVPGWFDLDETSPSLIEFRS